MFSELMPLLAGRTVLITVAKVDDKNTPCERYTPPEVRCGGSRRGPECQEQLLCRAQSLTGFDLV
jgi:hypothetical protein